jgi:hypothetical protein
MSSSSAKAGPGHWGSNLVPVLVALLLAWLSTGMNAHEQRRSAPEATVAAAAATPSTPDGFASEGEPAFRGLFAAAEGSGDSRSYHPRFRTSDSTGALGFWLLVSLCGLLLGAALAPSAIQWLWRHVTVRRSNSARHQG